MASRETENNVYAKFRGGKQRALWYVMVFLEWLTGLSIKKRFVEGLHQAVFSCRLARQNRLFTKGNENRS